MKISLFAGDRCDVPAEALCTSTNPRLSLAMGTGGSIRGRGGYEILRDCEAIVAASGTRGLPGERTASEHVGGRVVARAAAMRRTSHEFVIPAVPFEAGGHVPWFAMHDDLVRSVSDELRWDPRIDAERIVVSVDESTVTLAGTVRSYSEKCCAEKIAREIRGVIDVKNDLEVRLTIGSYRTDAGLARLTSEILQNHTSLCDPLPRITVRDGWLTLDGVVTSDVQKRCAEEALRDVAGIRGVTNDIVVAPPSNGGGAAESFEAAVRRRAVLTVRELKVEVSGMTMAVYGEVASCAERDALIELASRRRGIARVEDHVIVQPEHVRSVS